jgi:hypothetical protein
MPSFVRVIGRVDLADRIGEAVRHAGFDVERVTAGPMSVFQRTPPATGADIVVGTSIFDLPLWSVAKGRHPLRPMVAVAEQRREGWLRGAMLRRNGPDAYVTWPAAPEELAAAIRRAEASASRRRTRSAADLRAALVLPTLLLANSTCGVGAAVAGVCLLLGQSDAWSPRWQVVGGLLLTVAGVGDLVLHLVRWAA